MPASRPSWPGTTDLSTDTWLFEVEWDARRDDPANCAARLLTCLTGLAGLDPLLACWYYDTESVPLDEPSLLRRVEASWDTEFADHGAVVPLRNGMSDHRVASIVVQCGATAPYLHNGVELRPPQPAAASGLYRLDTMLGLFDLMIAAWQPRWCRVRPYSLRDATHHDTVDVLASWIAYLGHDVHTTTGALPDGITTIDRPDGTLFVLALTPDQLRVDTVDRLRAYIGLADARRLG
jgi:hypothetical protein